MATYSINEDGTRTYIPEHTPYDTSKREYGTLSLGGKVRENRTKVKKLGLLYDSKNKILSIFPPFRKYMIPMGEKAVDKFLPDISEHLRDYFIQQVKEHNEWINSLTHIDSEDLIKARNAANNKATNKTKHNIDRNQNVSRKKKNISHKKADAARIHADLKELQRKSNEIKKEMLLLVQQTGTTAQLGNFKISKLK